MQSSYEKRLMRVLQYIHDNPSGDLSLDNLADIAAMSRFHWHRIFHAMTGETCAQAVRRLRVHQAAKRLLRSKQTIPEIANAVGYSNINSFNRAFRDHLGVSPGEFRKHGQLGQNPLKIRKGNHKMFDVEIKHSEQMRLAALEHKGAYTRIGARFQQLFTQASQLPFWKEVKGVVAVYHGDPDTVPEQELRSHAALLVGEGTVIPDGYEEVRLNAGRYAVLRYKGPYQAIKVAYDHLFGKWLPEAGEEPIDAPCFEIYLNSPQEVAEEDLLTDIYLPLK